MREVDTLRATARALLNGGESFSCCRYQPAGPPSSAAGGQAGPFGAAYLAPVLPAARASAACAPPADLLRRPGPRPRRPRAGRQARPPATSRGGAAAVALERDRLDAAITGLLFIEDAAERGELGQVRSEGGVLEPAAVEPSVEAAERAGADAPSAPSRQIATRRSRPHLRQSTSETIDSGP